ncbi:MAG: nicotinamide riboside transporter PnuC [Acutalibacteraceae bacterium]
MKIISSIKELTKFEICLWICSIIVVSGSYIFSGGFYWLTLVASLIGVTALIFVAKGNVFGQILSVIFSLAYAFVSFKFRYYGEMITYLGMTTSIALISIYTWIKNPYKDSLQVKVHKITLLQAVIISITAIIVTIVFYFVLKMFNTANLIISTISITTSFTASLLMMLRSPYYAIAYGANDVVLIVLWVLASIEDISYLPMIMCFVMFLVNDIYGFISWKRMHKEQNMI